MSKFNPLLVAIIGLIVQFLLFSLFALIGLIDPFIPFTRLFEVNGFSAPENFESLGFVFVLWNYYNFSLTSSNFVFSSPFSFEYLLFFVVFSLSVLIASLFSKKGTHGVIGFALMIAMQIGIVQLIGFIIPSTLEIASLPPAEQETINSLGSSLTTISFASMFGVLLIAFIINIAVGISIMIIGNKFSFMKD